MTTFTTRRNGGKVDIPSKAFDKAADKLTRRQLARLSYTVQAEMKEALTRTSDALIARHSRPWSSIASRNSLAKRTGKGIDSLKGFMTRRTDFGVTGSMKVKGYMARQEFGGLIRAKGVGYLTVPLPGALNADGTPIKRTARDWKNTVLIETKGNNLVIFQKRGRKLLPLYVLKKKVYVPARLGLRKQLKSERPKIQRNIARRIRDMIEAG